MLAFDYKVWYNTIKGMSFMSSSLVQFRTEDNSKIKAMQICEKLGIDLPTYMRMCISRLIQENGIPFSMKIGETDESPALKAMKRAGQIAIENGISDMTLEEINDEISRVRGN